MSEQGALFSDDRPPAARVRSHRGPRFGGLGALPGGGADRPTGFRAVAQRAASALLAAGLVTVSWDRLLNVQVASYNVKLPSLVFTLAFALALFAARRPLQTLAEAGPRRIVALIALALVVYSAVRGSLSALPLAAFAQVAAMLTGAVLPAVAVLLIVRTRQDLRWALSWFTVGAVVASVFGLYQLLAFYLGWPQGVTYTGVGIGTGFGRISAFSYEPAYFSYYLVLALGAFTALRRLSNADIGWRGLIAFAVVLYLANARAVPVIVLVLGLFLLLAFRSNRGLLLRGSVVFAAALVVAAVVPLAVNAVGDGIARASAPSASSEPSASVRAEPTAEASTRSSETEPADPEETGPADDQDPAMVDPLQSVDPTEQSSNAPRLTLYTSVLSEIADSPVFGLGAGNLGAALQRDAPGAITDQQNGQVVANNIWLQALADGGVPQLLLEAGLVATVLVAALRRRRGAVYPMASAWLAVIVVGGMLTSYFFDIKVWVVLAFILVGFSVAAASEQTPARHGRRAL